MLYPLSYGGRGVATDVRRAGGEAIGCAPEHTRHTRLVSTREEPQA